jgi:hypothetical protein
MARKIRTLHKTIVIVCEDTVVTPTYLGKIRAEVMKGGSWENILVYPIPPSDPTTVRNNNPHKSERKIRTFLPGNEETAFEIEEEHKAVPVRYVREAQLRILESNYDEGWAVYDLDGHPRQAAAHNLSLTEPIIKIAFSSIAVEHWLLLHFTKDNTAYSKSADIPVHQFIAGYNKDTKGKINIYEHLRPHLDVALENAAWLRTINAGKSTPFYTINPYVDTDLLIKRLYEIDEEISWGYINEPFTLKYIQFSIIRDGTRILINISNNSHAGIVSGQIGIYTLDAKRKKYTFAIPHQVIVPGTPNVWEIEWATSGLLNITFENYRNIVLV